MLNESVTIKEIMMKKVMLITLLLFGINLTAEFQQTNGPAGGRFSSMAQYGNAIYGLTNQSTLFRYSDNQWQRQEKLTGYSGIFTFRNRLFALGYAGIKLYDDVNGGWMQVSDDYIRSYSISGEKLYVVINDTVYHSDDGVNFSRTFDNLSNEVELFGDTLSQRLINITAVSRYDSVCLLACMGELGASLKGMYISHDGGMHWMAPEGLPGFTRVYDIVKWNKKYYIGSTTGVFVSSDSGLTWQGSSAGFPTTSTNLIVGNLLVQKNTLYAIESTTRQAFRLDGDQWVPVTGTEGIILMEPSNSDQLLLSMDDGIFLYDIPSEVMTDISETLIASNVQVLARDNQTAIAYMPGNMAYLTSNSGEDWEMLPENFTRIGILGEKFIFADDAGVKMTEDLISVATSINGNLPSDNLNSISDLVVANGNIYVTFSRSRRRTHLPAIWEAGGVYISENSGGSWQSINSGLPTSGSVKVPIYNLYVNGNTLFANTADGTFRSTNNGNSWTRFENGLLDYERPIHFGTLGDISVITTYYGMKYSTPEMTGWEDITTGLDSVYTGYDYQYVNFAGDLYIYSNKEQRFYRLEDLSWSAVNYDQDSFMEISNFSAASDVIYASVMDGGVWKGDLTVTALEGNNHDIPQDVRLMQNFPNPFNPSTTISYSVNSNSRVTLRIYNILGEEIATLVNDHKSSGRHSVVWHGKNNSGNLVSAGIYVYQLTVNGKILEKKMMYLK